MARTGSTKLQICQFTPCLWSGGAEERMTRLVGSLDRTEFDVTWFGFGPIREAMLERAGPVRIEPIPRHPEAGVEPSVVLKIARVLRRNRPDIMHIHNWSTSAYGVAAARLAGVPHIVYESAGRESPEGPSARRRSWMRAMAPHVSRFTTVCAFLAREVVEGWGVPPSLVREMPTGVDLQRIARLAKARSAARARLGIPRDALLVGTLCALRPVKRIPDLIDAVALLAPSRPKLRLLVAGNPLTVSESELRERAEAQGLSGRFHLPGRIEDPAAILGAFDVFVNCSIFEGASNAIIEAMAAGLAVVGTRVGGTPELIEDGISGLLVPPRDVAMLSAAIGRLVDDPELRARFGANAQKRAARRHDHPRMVQAYVELYRELARTAPKSIGWTALKRLGETAVGAWSG